MTGLGSTGQSFIFQFGARGFYGVPSKFSGMVPQTFATWIDGLQPGTYFIRAYVNGYVQTGSDGSEFKDYFFKILSLEQNLGVFVPMDLYRSGTVEVKIHFHDNPGTNQDAAIGGPDNARYLVAEIFDQSGRVTALNFTTVSASSSSATISLAGLGMAGVILPPDSRAGTKYSLLRYRGLRDYGIPPATHKIRTYLRGYIQAQPPAENLQSLDTPTSCLVGP